MVHYSAKNIYFFIYDKEKLIDNLCNFKSIYEEKMRTSIFILLFTSLKYYKFRYLVSTKDEALLREDPECCYDNGN